MARKTYGPTVKERVKRLLEALFGFVDGEIEGNFNIDFNDWRQEDSSNPRLIIKTNLVALEYLTEKDKYQGKIPKAQIGQALQLLDKDREDSILKILQDNRTKKRGCAEWHFTLELWSKDKEKNLKRFDELWESNRPSQSGGDLAKILLAKVIFKCFRNNTSKPISTKFLLQEKRVSYPPTM